LDVGRQSSPVRDPKQEISVNNRWNAAARLWPHATLALLVAACGGGINDPKDENTVPVEVKRDTCEDNPLLAECQPEKPDVTPGETDTTDPSVNNEASELELARAAAENVLRVNCGGCHGPQLTTATARAGMNFIDDIDELVSQGKITPLDADNSPVVRRMREGSMPPLGTSGPRPSDRDIAVVADFVDNPLFWPEYRPAESCEGQLLTFDQLYSDIERDLREQESRDRPFTRYLTLANRYNAGVCADALDRERFAILKVVNMLSTRATIGTPTPIDDDKLTFRIDIRDYNWDEGINNFRDGWEAIIAESPYAVPFVGDQADNAREDAETDVPVLNADAFVDAAALGDLYYALIGVDTNQRLADFVSNDLGIDVQGDLEDGDVVRAGTTRSAISREDRVVERLRIGGRQGVLWQSFDSAPGGGGGSIFSDPFNVAQGGTDAIFTLPNGMLAFIIADDNDNIVTTSNLLLDTFQDDFIARTSVSCSNCHAQGFNMVTDEVKPFVTSNRFDFQRDEFQTVEDVYLDPADFAQVIADDSAVFQQSLQRAGLPTTGSDPVAGSYLRFNVDVDLTTAAGDLGVTKEDLEQNLNLLDPELAVLRNISLERESFSDNFEASLCVMQLISKNHPDNDRCDALLGN
jgi:mono/diheme cytochrome c family protein